MAADGFDLASFFSDCGVPPAASASVVSSGWDVEKFAFGFKSEAEFDDPEVLTELGVEEDFSRLHRAALKQAWNRCIQHCKTEVADTAEPSPKASTAASGSMAMDTSEGSWSEAFAPKLGGPTHCSYEKEVYQILFCRTSDTRDDAKSDAFSIGTSKYRKIPLEMDSMEISHVSPQGGRASINSKQQGS